jgi:N-acetylmuramoyl-L-alanine amidase
VISTLLLCVLLLSSDSNYLYYHQVEASPGDGVITLLTRYFIEPVPCNLDKFYALNNMDRSAGLKEGETYFLPVLIYRYNGKSIRSTIGNYDYEKALRIQKFNERLTNNRLRQTSYRDSRLLWVPYNELYCDKSIKESARTIIEPLLGKANEKITVQSDLLSGRVYYVVSGHGGPDPGAVGTTSGVSICEDEYAYDVSLRLFKKLIENGATTYLITQDPNDGIREERILSCDKDETCYGGNIIPLNQLERLNQRTETINQLYWKHNKDGAKDQICISIHVDSRNRQKRQDVFFCHFNGSKSGKKLATQLHTEFRARYRKHRKTGLYHGTVEERNLYVLKKTLPKAVLIELANIQNNFDHERLLLASNRQALANWLYAGLAKE